VEDLIKVQELEGKLHITTPYSEEFIAKIKKVRGAKWDSTNKVWTTPCEEKKVVYKILDDLFCYKGDQTAYKRFRLKAIDMDNKLICPECGHDKFTCKATIEATLIVSSDSTGETNYKLYEWDDVESIQYFSCQKCVFEFAGDEDECHGAH